MKKLLIALAAAATAVVASAEIKNQLDFEGADGTPYANDAPSDAAYPFASFGDKYLELEESYTPDANGGNILDMYIQFVACDEANSLEEGEKLGVYVDKADGYLVVVGKEQTKIAIQISGWHRLTVVPADAGFYVYVDGQKVQEEPFAGAGEDNSISGIEFKGSGKLDNFVARTTDPFVTRTTEVVGIGDFATGGEYFTEVSDEAIAAAAAAGLPLKLYGNAALTATLNAGDSFTLIKGGYELTGLGDKYTVNGNTYTRVSAWSDYLGDAVAGAYEIDNLTELKAFQANVGTLPTANLTFKLTADIELDAAWEGIGVKAGKDLVNHESGTAQATIDEDLNKFIAGAFSGTFDGGNRTISKFQMESGTDYGGFFNSVNDATIKNLKVSYKENKLCANSSATGGDTGATFVGVARNSTLQNLTALATEDVATVSASKDMAGIVAYLMAGSTVDSCTNELNVASLLTAKARKSGGIALITQAGTGTATIRNCKNSGTVTLANAGGQAGGIVGYVGQSTTIENCENTAAVKMLTHMGNTVTLQGVNKGNATVASYTGAATPGLNFATVDGDVATFVADDALVLDGTVEYKVMNANAAYAFAAAGTLALDQSLATATVTADTSKFVFTTSEPVGNVTTYMAVAGVASVGGQAYATLQDAIDNAGDNDVITILPGIDTTQRYNVFNRGGTFKFAYDTDYIALFMNGLLTADGFILQGMPVTESEDTVLVYSVVEGVAKMNSTWYASFESAYYAAPGSGATLLVKVDSDFTPTFPQASQNEVLKEFASVTFTTTSEEPIAIATSDGTTFIKSQNWSAPETATLTLASQTIASVATGTLNIPEGTTLAVASGASFANVGAITGAGVLSAVGLNPVTALQTDHVAALLADSAKWTGVVVLGNVSLGNDSLDYYGNVNSTVRLSNVDVNSLVIAGRSNNVKSLDVAGNGLTFNELAANTTIPCALTGDGSIVVKGSAAQQKVLSFTGDCSEFAGSLTIDSANGVAKVLFGTKDTAGNGSCLTVGSDASVKVASGKTWTVPGGYVINGSVKADGALNTADKIYGSGTITSTVAQTSKVGSSWSGTYNICWAGNNTTGISFDWYGQAKSKIVIPANHTLQGYIAVTANQSLTLAAGEFVVDGVLNLSNGYDYSTVGWKKISGSGTLKFAFAPSHWIKEKIEKLDGFTGSIEVSTTTQLEIAGVRVAAAPEAGARVVPITVNGNGTVGGDLKLYVGDEVQDVTLEFKADGAEGSGIYVAEPPAAKVAEIVDGEQYETLAEALAAATDGATVKLLADITLDARVEPNLGAGTALTIDLGGYTITREGTGGNGSAFDVKSGTVVIKNGTIDCTQDDTAIVKDGVYAITARSGAAVTLDGLTVKVNSQAGACAYPFAGATLAITSGTYRNNTAEPYQYKTGWTGMAVNQANVEQQLITISGGSFYQVNPAEGDDSGKVTSFLAANCESTYDSATGFWTVAEKQGFPGGSDGKTFTIDTAVQAALAEKIPEGKTLADPVEGKTSGVTYAQAYALGLLDEETGDVAKDVTSTIEIVDGKVVVSLDATAKAGYTVMLNVYEKASLTAKWNDEPTKRYKLGSEEEFSLSEGGSGFYKVGVTIEDAPSGN